MLSKIEITLIGLTFLRLAIGANINYQSRILTQRITHYENNHIDFNVTYFGQEGSPYMLLREPITPYNDLHIALYARMYDQAPKYLANVPLSLCQLLHDETVYDDLYIKQFNIPQIFNFAGRSCPIESPYIRLSPYVFPANFTLDKDIGCGYMNVEARLLKCDDGIDTIGNEKTSRNCETLLKSVSMIFIMSEACSTNQSFLESISDGLTDAPMVLTTEFPGPGQVNEAWFQKQNVDQHGSDH